MSNHRRAFLVLAVAVALVAGTVGVGSAGDDLSIVSANGQRSESPPAPPAREEATEVEQDQADAFQVLRKGRRADDDPPAPAERFVRGALGRRYGANPRLARLAATYGTNTGVYLVPGNGAVCSVVVVAHSVAGGCTDDRAAAAGELVATDSWQDEPGGPEHVLVHGAVPDGVDSVTLTTTEGSKQTVAVQRNVYAAELVGEEPASVAWQSADGSRHAQPVPYQAG
jgi:hypothetical protein